MKIIKKVLAVMLSLAIAASLTGCIHKKDEIAVTIGENKFTSAYYMCALVNAFMEGQNEIYEGLSEEEQNSGEEIDYFSKEIDGKKFKKWVKEKAMESLKAHAAYIDYCTENELLFTEEELETIEQNVSYYWYYGSDGNGTNPYASYYEPNGISLETYVKYAQNSSLAEVYFTHIYGEDGTEALSAKDVKNEILDNYILVDIVEASYDDLTDDEIAARKKLMKKHAEKIKNGEATFEEVYEQFNDVEEEDHEGHDHEDEDSEEEELEPINKYATVMDAESSTYYETFRKYKLNKPVVFEYDDDAGVAIVIKRKLSKDEYYLDQLDSTARHSLADEDFEAKVKAYTDTLKVKENKYATSRFKVNKITMLTETTY